MGLCSFAFTENIPKPEFTILSTDVYKVSNYCQRNSDNIYCWFIVENKEQCASGITGFDLVAFKEDSPYTLCLDTQLTTRDGEACSLKGTFDEKCWILLENREDCVTGVTAPVPIERFPIICFKTSSTEN